MARGNIKNVSSSINLGDITVGGDRYRDVTSREIAQRVAANNYNGAVGPGGDKRIQKLRNETYRMVRNWPREDKVNILYSYGYGNGNDRYLDDKNLDKKVTEALIINMDLRDLETICAKIHNDSVALTKDVRKIENKRRSGRGRTSFSTANVDSAFARMKDETGNPKRAVKKAIKEEGGGLDIPRFVLQQFKPLKKEVIQVLDQCFDVYTLTELGLKMGIESQGMKKKDLYNQIANKILLYVAMITGKNKKMFLGGTLDITGIEACNTILSYTSYSYLTGRSALGSDEWVKLQQNAKERQRNIKAASRLKKKSSRRIITKAPGIHAIAAKVTKNKYLETLKEAINQLGISEEYFYTLSMSDVEKQDRYRNLDDKEALALRINRAELTEIYRLAGQYGVDASKFKNITALRAEIWRAACRALKKAKKDIGIGFVSHVGILSDTLDAYKNSTQNQLMTDRKKGVFFRNFRLGRRQNKMSQVEAASNILGGTIKPAETVSPDNVREDQLNQLIGLVKTINNNTYIISKYTAPASIDMTAHRSQIDLLRDRFSGIDVDQIITDNNADPNKKNKVESYVKNGFFKKDIIGITAAMANKMNNAKAAPPSQPKGHSIIDTGNGNPIYQENMDLTQNRINKIGVASDLLQNLGGRSLSKGDLKKIQKIQEQLNNISKTAQIINTIKGLGGTVPTDIKPDNPTANPLIRSLNTALKDYVKEFTSGNADKKLKKNLSDKNLKAGFEGTIIDKSDGIKPTVVLNSASDKILSAMDTINESINNNFLDLFSGLAVGFPIVGAANGGVGTGFAAIAGVNLVSATAKKAAELAAKAAGEPLGVVNTGGTVTKFASGGKFSLGASSGAAAIVGDAAGSNIFANGAKPELVQSNGSQLAVTPLNKAGTETTQKISRMTAQERSQALATSISSHVIKFNYNLPSGIQDVSNVGEAIKVYDVKPGINDTIEVAGTETTLMETLVTIAGQLNSIIAANTTDTGLLAGIATSASSTLNTLSSLSSGSSSGIQSFPTSMNKILGGD